MSSEAMKTVGGPATGLMVTAGLGAVAQVVGILINLLGIGGGAAEGGDEAAAAMLSGGLGIVMGLVAIAFSVFIWIGAGKMKRLESYGMCMGAAIVAMIPCISPCCLIGLPIGIWALIVLNKPEVKEAFTG